MLLRKFQSIKKYTTKYNIIYLKILKEYVKLTIYLIIVILIFKFINGS
jgi:hypothetical protein